MTIRTFRNIALYLLTVTMFFGIGSELFLRMILDTPEDYYIWTPHLQLNFEPSEAATPGVSGTGRFMINSLGLRSDEIPENAQQKVYVLGGSTAIELYLDQHETWSYLIQDRLNQMPRYPRTWVGNLAKSSLATLHNLMHFKHLLPRLPKADLFINLVGANDLQLALKSSYLKNMTYEQHMSWAFSHRPHNQAWKKLALYHLFERVSEWQKKSKTGLIQTHNADGFITWKQCRQTAPPEKIVHQLPDLSEALINYRENLRELISQAQAYGAPMIFMTQPTLWKNKLNKKEFSLLLAGGIGPNTEWCIQQGYYSPQVLAQGMELFNQTLLEVCQENDIFCIDLASAMAKDARYFYDDMHFSEEGARKVAEVALAGILKFQKVGQTVTLQ